MTVRMTYWWGVVLALGVNTGCRSGTQDSSSSHFIDCALDRDCLSIAQARGCDGTSCVDDTGEPIVSDGETGNVGVIAGGAAIPRCDPALPLEKPVDLGEFVLVAEAEDGTHYVVGSAAGGFVVFRSVGTDLVALDVAGSGSGSDGVTLSVEAPEGPFTLWFAPEEAPVQAVLIEGESERFPDPADGEPLTLRDEDALASFDVQAAVSPMVVEYHARSEDGHEVVVVRPERYSEYENFRLFLGRPGEAQLTERRVAEVLRARDGGSTHMRFQSDGVEADAFFPVNLGGEPGEGPRLTIGAADYPLTRGDETLAGLESLDFVCFDEPPNGWRETSTASAGTTGDVDSENALLDVEAVWVAAIPDGPDGGVRNPSAGVDFDDLDLVRATTDDARAIVGLIGSPGNYMTNSNACFGNDIGVRLQFPDGSTLDARIGLSCWNVSFEPYDGSHAVSGGGYLNPGKLAELARVCQRVVPSLDISEVGQ